MCEFTSSLRYSGHLLILLKNFQVSFFLHGKPPNLFYCLRIFDIATKDKTRSCELDFLDSRELVLRKRIVDDSAVKNKMFVRSDTLFHAFRK